MPCFDLCNTMKAQLDKFRPFPPETLQSLRNYYRVGLTWSSNALEGNSLTESETKVVIEDGLTVHGKPLHDIYEALGHAEAYDYIYAMAESKDLTPDDICKLHGLFYKQIASENAGKYRQVKVFISGSRYPLPAPEKIGQLMNDFIIWLNKNESNLHPIELAAEAHKRFVFIHPFIDGNGRVARLLMNLILIRHGYPITIIPPILRPEYITLLEEAHRNPEKFIGFIAERVAETLREILRLLGNENDTDLSPAADTPAIELLQTIQQYPGLRVPELMKIVQKSRPAIERCLRLLRKQNLIEFRGAPKNGGYYSK